MHFSKRTKAVTAIAIAAIATGGAAIAQGGAAPEGPPGAQTPAASPPGSERAVDVVGETVAASVGALRRPRTADDALPPNVAKYVEWAPLRGANGRLARKALSKEGQDLYLLPGNGVVCLLVTGSGGGAAGPSCRTPAQLRSESGGPGALGLHCPGGSATELPACEGTRLFGVAPDGVDRVTVPIESGGSVSVPVVNNAYLIDTPGRPNEIRLEMGSRVIEQQVP
jgi:hypothetical protein